MQTNIDYETYEIIYNLQISTISNFLLRLKTF